MEKLIVAYVKHPGFAGLSFQKRKPHKLVSYQVAKFKIY
jgi:hypothetical protein